VCIGIRDAGEAGVVVEQALESSEIDLHGNRCQQRGACQQQSASGAVFAGGPLKKTCGAAGGDEEEQPHAERQHRHDHQPAGSELPHWQREQIEIKGPAEDWIDSGSGRRSPEPPERHSWPLG